MQSTRNPVIYMYDCYRQHIQTLWQRSKGMIEGTANHGPTPSFQLRVVDRIAHSRIAHTTQARSHYVVLLPF
jgi:hypothetical protein